MTKRYDVMYIANMKLGDLIISIDTPHAYVLLKRDYREESESIWGERLYELTWLDCEHGNVTTYRYEVDHVTSDSWIVVGEKS